MSVRAETPAGLAALLEALQAGGHESDELHETNGSWVALAGDRAYKLKKPVRFAFLDYSTALRRGRACRTEVEVNLPLAPDLYLGVRPLLIADGGTPVLGPMDAAPPGAIDYVVVMRRFREADTLAARLRSGEVDPADVDRVARRLAAFHADAAPADGGSADEALARWDREVEELGAAGGLDWRQRAGLLAFGAGWVAAHRGLLEARRQDGRVRDGHGDLRCDHVLLTDPVVVVDRLEFDPALRAADVAEDLAFLLMDLAARGAPGVAAALVRGYRGAGGDPGPDALLAFHAARRALISAKVACLGDDADAGLRLAREAARWTWRARGPLALVACGPPAAGKSTLAAELAERSDWPVIASDVARRASGDGTPRYAADAVRDTYRRVREQAAQALAGGPGVIVDATYRARDERDRLVEALPAPVVFVECRAPQPLVLERALRRDAAGTSLSDANADVARRLATAFEPLDDVPADRHVVVRTDRAATRVADDVQRWLDGRVG